MSKAAKNARPKPTRAEVEELTVLHAIGPAGCRTTELAVRLGLSTSLHAALVEGVQPMLIAGLLVREGDLLSVSAAGRTRLRTRLAELGLR